MMTFQLESFFFFGVKSKMCSVMISHSMNILNTNEFIQSLCECVRIAINEIKRSRRGVDADALA